MQRNSRLKKSNKMQQYADIYLQPLVQIMLSGKQACLLASKIVQSVLEAAPTVLCTPDDGRVGRPKHLE